MSWVRLLHLLQSSTCTCFEQYLAHPQEVKLYKYSIWYRHSHSCCALDGHLLTMTIPDDVLTHLGRGHLNCLNARSRGF